MFRSGLCALFLLPLVAFAAEQPIAPVDIKEWPVPWEGTRPRDPYVAPDGKIWFVGQQGDYVAEFDPDGEKLRRIDLDKGSGPHNLIVDASGNVWYAGNRASHIGRIDPGTGAIEKMPAPPEASDPHTMLFDGRGHIWFSSQHANSVGRMHMASGKVEVAAVPTPRARPYGLAVDQSAAGGRPWIALLGTHKLATVEPDSMQLREIALPRKEARPKRLALTGDGRLWYVDSAQGYLGVYNSRSGEFKEWRTPAAADAEPYAMAADHRGRIWFVETGIEPNRLVGFDPKSERFFSQTDIPSGAGSVRHMVFDANRKALWFGTDANTLGRARLPE